MYTHLIIGGGGIKGAAIIGSLKVLFDHNLLEIEGYIGSSIGGLICFLLNIGYTCEELNDIMLNIDFSYYREINFSSMLDKWGLDSGESIMKLISAIVKQKSISIDITFIELYNKTQKLLVLTGSELLHNVSLKYNYIITPNMKILDAIRITISYPIIFYPLHNISKNFKLNPITNIEEEIEERQVLVDGGMFAPYPMNYFKDKDKKIGIYVHETYNINKIVDGEDYLISIFNCLQERFEQFYLEQYKKDTIVIDIQNIHSMDFSVTKQNKYKMYEIGIEITEKYLKDNKIIN